jgi:hypothetical protein
MIGLATPGPRAALALIGPPETQHPTKEPSRAGGKPPR